MHFSANLFTNTEKQNQNQKGEFITENKINL